jgi:UDP:flavonoid glycosyltransferase YjiC (YdhE family)
VGVRVLLTTRGSAGHLLPLAPFGHACLRAGHDVLVAAQPQHRANVERAGLAFWPTADPPAEQWMALMAQFGTLGIEQSNARMVGEFFARIDTRAALPRLRALVETWRPDVIVRETWEFASALVAELYGIALVRVGLGLAAVEELSVRLAAPAVDAQRAALGLAPDPDGARLRETPYLTTVPAPLDDPDAVTPPLTHRFAPDTTAAAPAPVGDWWPGNDDPLVLVSFGSVAAAGHLPYFPALYRAAIDALAPLRVRLLVTTGDGGDPAQLGALPDNVRVERWVAQDAVAPHAAAMVCHGGYGSTLGALRHGVPLVVLPLFSTDQWANAAAVARAGAGVALDAEYATRPVLGLPSDETFAALRPALTRVLSDDAFARGAGRIAAAAHALAPVDAAVDVLARTYATYTGVPTGARA